jgi:ribulose-5-phosphate 4-epimerase/fuculose-1-phosphate aldolase
MKEANEVSSEENARVHLAAFYRLVEQRGWGDGIFNHISLRIPENPDEFLIKPHELTYDEVTASNLIKVNAHAAFDPSCGVNHIGFATHAPVLRRRPDVACAVHLHTPQVMAMSALSQGFRFVHQDSIIFYNSIGYFDFPPVLTPEESGEQMAEALGQNRVLVLRNHGILLVGPTINIAFRLLDVFMLAVQTQVLLAPFEDVAEIPQEACERISRQLSDAIGHLGTGWPAWVRRTARLDPSFAQ